MEHREMWQCNSEIARAVTLLPQRIVQRGQRLFNAGEALESIDIITAGAFKITQSTAEGDEWISRFKFSGEWIGLSDYPGEQHSVSAYALDTSAVRRLPLPMLAKMLRDEETRPTILAMMNHNLRQHLNYAVMRRMRARDRLAEFLHQMSGHYARQGYSARSFHLPMSRNEMANYLDLTPETVSRELKTFERTGSIRTRRNEITLVGVNSLLNP